MIASSGHHRLEQLYQVSKLFNGFASVDDTVGKALQVVAATLPLESALLIQATIACHTELTVWQCEDSEPARVAAAKAHAEAIYAYLVGARSIDSLDLHDRVGSTVLPAPRDRQVSGSPARRCVMIPLVVARGMVFGALQLEAAAELDRDDIEFISALANQLAIALERDRTRRHDIMRRREAQLSQARYESIVDRLDGAFVWEADLESHRVSYVSAQFERLLGFTARECLDERNWWRSHAHPDDRGVMEAAFARALAERGHQRCEHRVIASDDAVVWLHTSLRVADVPGETPRYQALSHDITAVKIVQDRVQYRLALVSAVIAHFGEGLASEHASPPAGGDDPLVVAAGVASCASLEPARRTSPLATIALASEILGDELADRDPGARSIAVTAIRRATERMRRLVHDLLDFASIETGGCVMTIVPQDVSAIIAESTANFQPLAAMRAVTLVGEAPADMPPIYCDRDRVLQVIANLLRNALGIVNRGGAVYLRVNAREREAVFSVTDTGPGIPPAEHARLFERDAAASHPGLGLAVARGIVERHGGRIWADSELGRGATFFFTIPLATRSLMRRSGSIAPS